MNEIRLPAEPLVVIQPSNRWSVLSFKDIWAYRELLFFLTWRDVKVRYKQTALGATWAILQPLFMMIIFTIFFGRLAAVDSAGIPYPLFALAVLLFCVLMVYYGVGLTMQVLFLPVLVVLTALFALGVGTWMSALNVKYRDVRFALPFII